MKPLLQVNGIDHVALNVRDMQRARAFYVDVLGMQVIQEAKRMCFLQCGEQMITLLEIGEAPTSINEYGLNHLALRVLSGDYQTIRTALEQAGFQVSGRAGDIYFSDPDGYAIQIVLPQR